MTVADYLVLRGLSASLCGPASQERGTLMRSGGGWQGRFTMHGDLASGILATEIYQDALTDICAVGDDLPI